MRTLHISKEDNILILAPHPDDESIGCGGLLNMYPNQIDIVVMTDGARGDVNTSLQKMKTQRKKEFESAVSNVDVRSYDFLDYPDGELAFYPKCMNKIDFQKYTKVFIPHCSEAHADHKATFEYAIKEMIEKNLKEIEVYQYETRAAINEDATAIDISNCIEDKLRMVRQYVSQTKEYDYVEFVKALAKYHATKENYKDSYWEVYIPYTFEDKVDNYDSKMMTSYRIKNELLELWLGITIEGKKISDYVLKKYTSVAIYGYGFFGRLLYKDITNSDGKVAFVVDIEAEKLHENGIRFILPDRKEDVDLLVVSNLFGGEIIKQEMLSLGYENVITLRDILLAIKNVS